MQGHQIGVAALLAAGVLAMSSESVGAQQEAKSFEKEIRVTVRLNYLLALPEGYQASDKAFPLLLFLHGAGESGSDLELVKTHGPPKLIAAGKKLPFIVVSPQTPILRRDPKNLPLREWNVEALNALLDEILAKYRVDRDRVYVTGLSMGGNGTWRLAAASPERFAAIVPICGWGDVKDAPKLKNLPIWNFHGAKDKAVPLARSEEMIEAIKRAGGEPKFTVYPKAEHDSWTETYDNPEVYTWLLSHKRRN